MLVMREKNCGWRIDVYYANEGMMTDVISSDVLSDVPFSQDEMNVDVRSWARIIVLFR